MAFASAACAGQRAPTASPTSVEIAAPEETGSSRRRSVGPSRSPRSLETCIEKIRQARQLEATDDYEPYRHAWQAEQRGSKDEATRGFVELTNTAARQEIRQLAWLGLGELSRVADEQEAAQRAFLQVDALGPHGSPAQLLANLRLAQVQAAVGGPDEVITTCVALVGPARAWTDDCASFIEASALGHLVVAYAQARRPEEAMLFFHDVIGEPSDSWQRTREIVADLADEYAKQERDDDAGALIAALLMGATPSAGLCDRVVAISQKLSVGAMTPSLKEALRPCD